MKCKKCKRDTKGKKCGYCRLKKWRKDNPIKYAYSNLKNNAKQRGKFFDLTFEQFKKFAIKTEYIKKAGIKKNAYHIDRIDEYGGYTVDNIQLLTNSENSKKFHTEFVKIWNPRTRRYEFNTRTSEVEESDFSDVPF